MEEQLSYSIDGSEGCDGYSEKAIGPGDFECFLGEPEDRSFSRDAWPCLVRLNELNNALTRSIEWIRTLKGTPAFSSAKNAPWLSRAEDLTGISE